MGAAPGPSSVLLAGGGSAGHVSPLLALADALRRRDPEVAVTALGTETGLEARLVPARGYELRLRAQGPAAAASRPGTCCGCRVPCAAAVAAARQAIDETGAEVVVGFGGYVSTPAYLAARQRRIPIVVHEQNARAGLANRLGRADDHRSSPRRSAARCCRTPRCIGMPLRREVSQLDRAARRDEGMAHFGLGPAVAHPARHRRLPRRPAAQRRPSPRAPPSCSAAGVQVLHVTGAGKEFEPERPTVGRALRRRALRRPHGAGLRRGRPRRLPRRAPTRSAS